MKPKDDLTIDYLPYNSNQESFTIEIYQKINEMINTINNKDSAIYSNEQFYTCGKWYINNDPRTPAQLMRKVISFGALPNTATRSIPHELNGANPINADWIVIPIAGRSFNPAAGFTTAIFGPYIEVTTDYTNINITTTLDYSAFTTTEIILLYIQP